MWFTFCSFINYFTFSHYFSESFSLEKYFYTRKFLFFCVKHFTCICISFVRNQLMFEVSMYFFMAIKMLKDLMFWILCMYIDSWWSFNIYKNPCLPFIALITPITSYFPSSNSFHLSTFPSSNSVSFYLNIVLIYREIIFYFITKDYFFSNYLSVKSIFFCQHSKCIPRIISFLMKQNLFNCFFRCI